MSTAEDTVNAFIKAVSAQDLDGAAELFDEEIEYHNIPMDPITGSEAAKQFLANFLGDECEFIVHRQAASDNVVLNERTDRLHMNGKWVEIKVCGVFEVRNGKITLWRDYFDMKQVMDQMS